MLRRCIAVLVVALVARPAAAGFDLSIDPVFTLGFTPDVVIDFEDFSIGEILESGDPVAPGVTFGGHPEASLQQAIVVDTGGGNLALQQINLGSVDFPNQTEIAFTFSESVRSVGADVDAVGNGTNLFPQARCFGAGDEYLNFVNVGGTVNSFMGFRGEPTSTPIEVLVYNYYLDVPATGMVLDDLAVAFVPESSGGVTAGVALASVASLAYRRSQRA